MKKSLNETLFTCSGLGLALALAHAIPAQAQSSVTIYGAIDGGVRYLTNANAAGGSKVYMGSNGWNSSNRIDIAGSEDLGGGMEAHFVLENGFNLATGALDNTNSAIFNRQSIVGMRTAYGTVDMGRQYTISHDLLFEYDPFAFNYTSLIPLTLASSGTRFNNDIKYIGKFGPFKLILENAFGEQAGNFGNAGAHGAGLQYYVGDLTIGGSWNRRSVLVGTTYRNEDYYLAGAAYKLGNAAISGGYMIDTIDMKGTTSNTVTRNLFAGGSYAFSAQWKLTGGWYRTTVSPDKASRRDMTIVGLDYFLSRRTKLFTELDYTKWRNAVVSSLNTVGVDHQTAMTVGINHKF